MVGIWYPPHPGGVIIGVSAWTSRLSILLPPCEHGWMHMHVAGWGRPASVLPSRENSAALLSRFLLPGAPKCSTTQLLYPFERLRAAEGQLSHHLYISTVRYCMAAGMSGRVACGASCSGRVAALAAPACGQARPTRYALHAPGLLTQPLLPAAHTLEARRPCVARAALADAPRPTGSGVHAASLDRGCQVLQWVSVPVAQCERCS